MIKSFAILLTAISILWSSSLWDTTGTQVKWERPEVIFPDDNPLSEASIELGSSLFFETLLSQDSTLSCQSCHLITEAFADHLPLGEGIKGRHVTRNTPTLSNIGNHPYFMADGKFETLEDQVLGPINEHREFDLNAKEVVERLKTVPFYNEYSLKAYNQEITIEVVQKALANFQRILRSDSTKFDQYMRGLATLTAQEKQGWDLFNAPKLNCIQCHGGFNFTNYSFQNNGLYQNYQDSGRALITKQPQDLALFKVPTLRNIAITYPYMHDGSMNSLNEVVDHYAAGGKKHISQSNLIQGFNISKEEKEALIAFLNTLTDSRYLEKSESSK